MARIIIAGSTEQSREQLSRLLASSGHPVFRCCSNAGELRRVLNETEDGLLILAGRMADCRPDDLVWDYGERVRILLIAKPAQLEDVESREIFRLQMPASGQAIVGALEMLSQLHRMRMPRRMGTERQAVEEAKKILMSRHGLSEPEAHHLLQKYAMDHGVKMADYAADIVRQSR